MGAGLFAKLVVLVLAVGGTAVGVLALRQSRLQAGHEAAEARLRMRAHAERTMELRARIASQIAPEALAEHAGRPGLVHAIEARPDTPHAVTRDADDAYAPDDRWRP